MPKPVVPLFHDGETPLYEMEPINPQLSYRNQLKEIQRRLVAMAEYCERYQLHMTPIHMRNVLRIDGRTYNSWLRGTVRVAGKNNQGDPEYRPDIDANERRFIKERAEKLAMWESICDQATLDAVAVDTIPARSIFPAKAIFKHFDQQQATSNPAASMEALLARAAQIKNKEKPQKKKAQW